MPHVLTIATIIVLAALAVVAVIRPRKGLDEPRVRERDTRLRTIAKVLFPLALALVAVNIFMNRR
ncbi:MAG: hypothetical protein EPN93_00665 [Spirochaetes bacterium]|nr:MAG: hypothetical protein EPN93_00665 [Spirochaetota bacterium]